jgi:hypothetical protein
MKYFTFARFVTLQALKKLRLAIVNAVDDGLIILLPFIAVKLAV